MPSLCHVAAIAVMLLLSLVGVSNAREDPGITLLRPKYHRVDGHIETVWQRPPTEQVRGIAFVAHGCMHQSTDLFSEVGHDGYILEECAKSNFGRCLGLPEELKMRRKLRQRGYLVLGVSGGTGVQSCWNVRTDAPKIAAAIDHVRTVEGLPSYIPIIAIGISSGGAMVGKLAAPVELGGLPGLSCISPIIMGLGGAKNRGIPTIFVHMPRDERTAYRVEEDIAELQLDNVPVKELQSHPKAVSVELLMDCLSEEDAQLVLEALNSKKLLDAKGFLLKDARSRLWVNPVKKALADRNLQDSLLPDESCLAEVLNVAFASHEFTAEYTEEILDFCEAHIPTENLQSVPREEL